MTVQKSIAYRMIMNMNEMISFPMNKLRNIKLHKSIRVLALPKDGSSLEENVKETCYRMVCS